MCEMKVNAEMSDIQNEGEYGDMQWVFGRDLE